jgi:serine/threonine protein kinase
MPLILNHRYIPEKTLGHGGFGRTFLASDSNFPGSKRVIKQFSSANLLPMQINQAEKAFEKESGILDKLRHPKIPRVFSYFTVRTGVDSTEKKKSLSQPVFFYMAQDYVEGQNLQQELQTGKIHCEKDILILLRQILEVLEYIHDIKESVIHCDIKPSNIIYHSQDKTYYLIDFGAVKRTKIIEDISESSPELHFMSPGFSPPEQYYGKTNASSDLYALGMTCICLLTNKKSPFDLDLPEDREQWKETASISPKLTQVLSKMIELNPGDRYRTAADIRQALDLPRTLLSVNPQPIEREGIITPKVPYKNLSILRIIGISFLAFIVLGALAQQIYKNIIPKSLEPTLMQPLSPQPKGIPDVGSMPSETTKFGGSSAWAELYKSINSMIEQYFPGSRLIYIPYDKEYSNSEHGIEMLIEGRIDFAISSKGIQAKEKKMAQEKGIILESALVAKSPLVVVVNPMLDVPSLTKEQIQKIRDGDIKNWNEVGSKQNIPIKIYTKDKKYSRKVEFKKIASTTISFQEIAKDLGGVDIVAAALAIKQCEVKILPFKKNKELINISPWKTSQDCPKDDDNKKIDSEKLKKYDYMIENLSVVINKDGGDKQKSGETYANIILTAEGQDSVQSAGYLKIK